jgi:hypothetical protein
MFSESRLTVFAARSFSQVRKLYSSSTPFRPPLIPDSTRNHPPAMSSRNTSTRFAQHLDMLPNRGPPSIIPSLQRRTDRLYRPLISDLARRCMMENMIWCSNSARTCVVLVGNQARLMKVTNLDTRLIQTKVSIPHLRLSD